jgi:membrane protease YdiL (CAAX protease family)
VEALIGAMVADQNDLSARPAPPESTGPLTGALYAALAAYVAMATIASGIALVLGRNPLACEGSLGAQGEASWLLSLGAGVALGAITVAATRVLMRRAPWARALHVALRPAVHGASNGAIAALAVASALGEELLFRGVLVPLVGVVLSSLLFGLLHQVRGPARWAWMAWATLMGTAFGAVFALTGNLAGPVLAHAVINHANLRFLRDNDPAPRKRRLGGLLER